MKLEYEIVKRNDGMYAICENRYMPQSINTKQVYVSESRKQCVQKLKEIKKVSK